MDGHTDHSKSRLPVPSLTQEDRRTWLMVSFRMRLRWDPMVSYRKSLLEDAIRQDRRDADLMLHLRIAYQDVVGWYNTYPGVAHVAWAFQGIPISPREGLALVQLPYGIAT